jgi:hypothetical protein
MRSTRLKALGGAVASAALLGAAPGIAQGASVTPTVPCVGGLATGGAFPLRLNGFTPGSFVTVKAGNDTVTGTQVDINGNAVVSDGTTPFLGNRNQATFQLTATDSAGGVAAPSSVKVTKWTVDIPSRAHATHKVRYRAFGFIPGRRVNLFVRRGGRTRGSFSLGKAKGSCGIATRRLRYMPLRHYSTGNYQYFFEQTKHFNSHAPRIRLSIFITRVFR